MDSTPPSVRRSTRNRPAKRYTDDTFEGYGNLPSDVVSDADTRDDQDTGHDLTSNEDEEEEFTRDVDEADLESEGYREDHRSNDADSSEEAIVEIDSEDSDYPVTAAIRRALKKSGAVSQRSHRRPTGDNENEIEDNDDDDENGEEKKGRLKRTAFDTAVHSISKLERYIAIFGENQIDMLATLRCRDRWSNNEVLPQRLQNEDGQGGFHRSYYEPEYYEPEGTMPAWDWMFEGGQEAFRQSQVLREITKHEASRYLPEADDDNNDDGLGVLMGPRSRQKLRWLKTGECATVEELWTEAETANPPKVPPRTPRTPRQGWMLNAGSPVKDLNWVPTGEAETQFVAVATSPAQQEHLDLDEIMDDRPAPAFAPRPPTPACIQFWGFASDSNPQNEGMMDLVSPPQLRLVLCTDWGDVLQSKWCTVPADPRAEKQPEGPFALLAGIWGDGRVKVLQLPLNLLEGPTTRYIHVERVAFESCPPDTVCTCLDWISPSEIIVGCANGFVAVWDISESLCEPNPPLTTARHSSTSITPSTSNPRPYLYFPLHQTYILAVVSCAPSRPQLISTSAMDGFVRLTDLRSPVADTVVSGRTRLGSSILAWSDTTQSVLCTEENNTIRSLSLRHFSTSTTIARLHAPVSCITSGVTHSSVMAGGLEGSVELMNPMRRLFLHKGPTTQLKWFLHEWSGRNEKGGKNGICRITEGFKLDSPPLLKNTQSSKARLLDGTLSATIYEEKTAVTHVTWCPSVRCGGWAAAGMGSGLIRIEDLAV